MLLFVLFLLFAIVPAIAQDAPSSPLSPSELGLGINQGVAQLGQLASRQEKTIEYLRAQLKEAEAKCKASELPKTEPDKP